MKRFFYWWRLFVWHVWLTEQCVSCPGRVPKVGPWWCRRRGRAACADCWPGPWRDAVTGEPLVLPPRPDTDTTEGET